MDPSQNEPYRYLPISPPSFELAVAGPASGNETLSPLEAPLSGEVLPPAAGPVLQYPIGLIDFNQPIIVVDSDNDQEVFDNPGIVTVLKGSLYPVVISFWQHGEQRIAQFDTDGDSLCNDYKVEQDQPYPRTLFVVVGREGRNLVLDPDLYPSEDAGRAETGLEDIAGIYPVVVEAKADEVQVEAPQAESVSDFDDGGGVESEEGDDEDGAADTTSNVTDINQPPTEMYVASRMRHVGETVHAYRSNFGVRVCTILKLRRDARKSLYIDPRDGNDPYWALNKNIRY
jgi:hypothetical protein